MKFCIIGGRGRMGRLFEKILVSKGHEVLILGRGNYDKLEEFVKDADITIVSTPLSVAAQTIIDVSKVIDKDKLVVDFSSVMGGNVEAMKSLPCGAAFVHPLFGPDIDSLKNQNFIVASVNKSDKLEGVLDFIREEEGNLTESKPEEHDKIMGLIQCLTHFNNMIFAKTLTEQKIFDTKLTGFATVLFRINKNILAKMFSQSADMTANLQIKNPNFAELLDKHKENFEELFGVVKNNDIKKFEKIFEDIAKKLDLKEESIAVKVKKPVKKWDKDAIAVLGPRGSFSDAACEFYLKDKKGEEKVLYGDTIKEVLKAIKDGKVKLGIIPIENSIQGTINETLDGINYNGLHIAKVIVMNINHCLAALPGHGEIQTILSHPQALTQCSRFIEKYYPNAKLKQTLSTAEAFQSIKEKQLVNSAAVGPELAAEIYGLSILKEDIEDEQNNQTRFVVVSRDVEDGSDGTKTSIVVLPFHERQGLLFNLLKFFAEEGINLTKIESRPMKDELGKYIFYMDFDGNVNEENAQKALAKIAQHVGSVKILGCYETIEKGK